MPATLTPLRPVAPRRKPGAYDAHAAASDTGVLLTNLASDGLFKVDGYSASGYDDTAGTLTTHSTSTTGVLVNWAADTYAGSFEVMESTDGGSTFSPAGYAGAGDTGMLLTGLPTSSPYVFEVDAFTSDGTGDATGSASAYTGYSGPGGSPGVFTVASDDISSPIADAASAPSSSLSIVNSTVAAGSEEEAILLSLGGSINAGSATFTPLSGAFQFYTQTGACMAYNFTDYATTRAIDGIGDAGTTLGDQTSDTHTDVLGIAESWVPGDDPSGYDFHDAFMRFSVTKVADFSASVQATSSIAARDSATPAIFTLTRTGDLSASGTVHFTMSDSTSADDYTLTPGDSGALSLTSGVYAYSFAAGQTTAYVYMTPGATSTTNYDITLSLTDSYAGVAASFGSAMTDSQPVYSPLTTDVAHIVSDPTSGGFTVTQVVGADVLFAGSTGATSTSPVALVMNDSSATIHIGRPDWVSGMKYQVYDVTTSSMLASGSLAANGSMVSFSGASAGDNVTVTTYDDINNNNIVDTSEEDEEVYYCPPPTSVEDGSTVSGSGHDVTITGPTATFSVWTNGPDNGPTDPGTTYRVLDIKPVSIPGAATDITVTPLAPSAGVTAFTVTNNGAQLHGTYTVRVICNQSSLLIYNVTVHF